MPDTLNFVDQTSTYGSVNTTPMFAGWKGYSDPFSATLWMPSVQSAANILENTDEPQLIPTPRREVTDIPGSSFVNVHVEEQIVAASVWSTSSKSAPGLLDNWRRIAGGRVVERKSKPLFTTDIDGYLFECSISGDY
ncbi:hypothetical protein DL93DRAFT_2172207 [Clavulina sp. PMI_390]|nr:hypothetical protein DL93DRAFT_2172207 [Clavulina sp. PMI_390]